MVGLSRANRRYHDGLLPAGLVQLRVHLALLMSFIGQPGMETRNQHAGRTQKDRRGGKEESPGRRGRRSTRSRRAGPPPPQWTAAPRRRGRPVQGWATWLARLLVGCCSGVGGRYTTGRPPLHPSYASGSGSTAASRKPRSPVSLEDVDDGWVGIKINHQ